MLDWKSNKIKRVCRSTFGSELLACGEGLDHALFYRKMLNEMDLKIKQHILFTDSKSLIDAVMNLTNNPSEKRLKVELSNIRELMHVNAIKIQWVESAQQLADVLTKSMSGFQLLEKLRY